MIAWLSGKLLSRSADAIVIDVAGVGYQVAVPLSTAQQLPEAGQDVSLHIHTHLREDSLSLFGFASELEKEVFLLLMGVSGIGPKLALAVLSGLAVNDLLAAIREADDARLCSLPGIGKKTAARVCLELKDKIKHLVPEPHIASRPSAQAGPVDDAVSALVNLGYRRTQAEEAVKKIAQLRPDARLEDLVREALGELHGRS